MNRTLKEVIRFAATILLFIATAGFLWWYMEPGFLYEYNASEVEVWTWIADYRIYGILLPAVISTVIAVIWRVIYSPLRKNSQNHYKNVLPVFSVFALIQTAVLVSIVIFVRGFDKSAVYLPLMFLLPFAASTVYIAPVTYKKSLFGFLNNTVGTIIFAVLYVLIHVLVAFF